MKIGLVRHFKTAHQFILRCDSEEYNNEYDRYENSHIIPVISPDYTEEYSVCYASTAPRALETAAAVYKKEIIPIPELREVPLHSIFNTGWRLPIKLWHILNRTGWAFNMKKMPETRDQTKQRALRVLAEILAPNPGNDRVLVVSHGFFMVTLQEELIRMGFKGKEFIRPEHGGLYEFFR